MADERPEPVFPVGFDEDALTEDLERNAWRVRQDLRALAGRAFWCRIRPGVSPKAPYGLGRLREEEYVFDGGIRVRGSQGAEEHAEISEGENNTLEMLINDRLKPVNGASKRR